MPNTMLNFKYGLFKNLPTTQAPGTVYVTGDEKAMYVDLPAIGTAGEAGYVAADRIRISQIVVKNSYRDAQPPFSADAFYYFVSENALLKWNPTGGEDGSGAWVQINSVSDVTANLDKLTARVGANETAIGNLQAADTRIEGLITAEASRADTEEKRLAGLIGDANGGLTKALADEVTRADTEEKRLAGLIGDNTSAIGGLQTRMGTAEGEIDALQGVVGDANGGLVKDLADLAGRVGANETAIGQHTTAIGKNAEDIGAAVQRIGANETAIGNLQSGKVDKTTYEAKIEALQGEIDAAEEVSAGLDGRLTTAEGKITTAEGKITAAEGRIGANETAIGNLQTNKVDKTVYEAKIEVLQGEIDAAEGVGAGLDTRLTQAEKDIDKNTEDIGKNAEGVAANLEAIGGLQTRMGTAEGDIDALEGRMGTAEGQINTNKQGVADNLEAINGLKGRMDTAEGQINTNKQGVADNLAAIGALQTRATDLETAVGELEQADADLRTYVDNQFAAANSMHFKGGVSTLAGLPLEDVEAGDTYIVTGDFKNGSVQYYAGDLLVAKKDQDADVYSYEDWTHVTTGYSATQENKLVADADANAFALNSYLGTNLGDIAVVAADSALKATVEANDSGIGGKLNLSIEWGTF